MKKPDKFFLYISYGAKLDEVFTYASSKRRSKQKSSLKIEFGRNDNEHIVYIDSPCFFATIPKDFFFFTPRDSMYDYLNPDGTVGGRVSMYAKIHPTAYIEKGSEVYAGVEIAENQIVYKNTVVSTQGIGDFRFNCARISPNGDIEMINTANLNLPPP